MGFILKRLRQVYGDSAKDFSVKLGLSSSYLSEIENGKKNVSISILTKYAEILGIKVSSIILIAEDEDSLKKENKFKQLVQPIMKKIMLRK
ncbi:XRE family transcriptional regulator [Apilactobacillus micheneri]|uniref:XRE family transcriptional regulator n=1 Tax=Apilactobacillus micheneri TaxID=1899430 RepID=A0ABY2YWZ6_9LACO|nr:XRE family transcriptional regulator [Apilactobacillus micheneri]TPR24411.1 XRE family transcriptional regulator [Apilactobacillus micheneri]TPR27289.1 XRE family transcriptional regulator [Apilactobacillus micheneri]TPR28671.1 XRE family transcriptional regulator [Apilactobacillus micheneri]TPR28731.1 XRE family transcriptional regulator [Apilactobacillus micheneri]